MEFAAHADALHKVPGGVVVEEAVGGDGAHAEVFEAVADEFMHGFGGVAVARVDRVEDPAELCLRVVGLMSGFQLGPGVLTAKHEIADDSGVVAMAEGDRDGGCKAGRF